jgi:hypothetical protein
MKAVVVTAPPAFVAGARGGGELGHDELGRVHTTTSAGQPDRRLRDLEQHRARRGVGLARQHLRRRGSAPELGDVRSWSSQVFYAKNIAAGANTVTATFATALGGGWGTVYMHEYSGVDRTNPLDVEAAAIGTSRAMSVGPVTTTSASLSVQRGRVVATGHRGRAGLHAALDGVRQPDDGPDLVRGRHVQRDDDPGPEPVGPAPGGVQVRGHAGGAN